MAQWVILYGQSLASVKFGRKSTAGKILFVALL